MERLFTREEAEEYLPHVAPLLWKLKQANQELAATDERLKESQSKRAGNGHGVDVDTARAIADRGRAGLEIESLLKQVSEMAIEVKDIDQGLIDFRSRRNGRVVYLCWKLGEEHIEWWHEIDAGYAGRQRLD